MKLIITALTLLSASTLALAQAKPEAPAPTLVAGTTVTPAALGKIEWVRGEAPKEWEPGKVYILECWATWCGPCVAAIPHVNELYKTYSPKGLRVIGVNVWEDGKDKVAAFVTDKAEGMTYPVAYTGKGGVFETEWLKTAGVTGIPNAFVIKDGKLLFRTHPMQLTNEIIEGLLAGGEAQAKVVASINQAAANRDKLGLAVKAFREAARQKDPVLMEEKLKELEKIDATYAGLNSLRLEIAIIRKDWAAVEAQVKALPDNPNLFGTTLMTARPLSLNAEVPVTLWKALADRMESALAKQGGTSPMEPVTLADAQWRGGNKDGAIASARKAVTVAEKATGKTKLPVGPFQTYLKSLEEGKLPTQTEFYGWLQEAMKTAKAAGKVN